MCFAVSKTAITMTIMNECQIFPAKQAFQEFFLKHLFLVRQNPANQKYTYDLAVSSQAAKKLDQSVLSSSI